jgi:hypothetical protein
MELDESPGRLRAVLRARGVGRFFSAGFLLFWLSFWAVGEAVALAVVLGVIGARLAPELMVRLFGSSPQVSDEVAVPVGLFMLLWLTFWTLGGVAALHSLARQLWGRDELELSQDRLVLFTSAWPWRKLRELPARSVRALVQRNPWAPLRLELETETVQVTDLGSREERQALREALQRRLKLRGEPAPDETPREVPAGWECEKVPGHQLLLQRSRRIRRQQAIFCFALAGLVAVPALIDSADGRPTAGMPILAVLFSICAVGGHWLWQGEEQWLLGHGKGARIRRWAGREWRRTLDVCELVVERTADSDGDEHYRLFLFGAQGELTLERQVDEKPRTLGLGRYLAAHSSLPLRIKV